MRKTALTNYSHEFLLSNYKETRVTTMSLVCSFLSLYVIHQKEVLFSQNCG